MNSETKIKIWGFFIIVAMVTAKQFEPIKESIRQRRVAAELQGNDTVLAATAINAIKDGWGHTIPIAFGRPSPDEIVGKFVSEAPHQRTAADCLRLLSILREIGTVGGEGFRYNSIHDAALLLQQELVFLALTKGRSPSSQSVTSVNIQTDLNLDLPPYVETSGFLLRVPSQDDTRRGSQIAYFNEDAPLLTSRRLPQQSGGYPNVKTNEIAVEVRGKVATRNANTQSIYGYPLVIDNPTDLPVLVVVSQREELKFISLVPRSWYEATPNWRSLLLPSANLRDGKDAEPTDVVITVIEWNVHDEEKRLWTSSDERHPKNRVLAHNTFVFMNSPLVPLPEWYLYSIGGQTRYSFRRILYQ